MKSGILLIDKPQGLTSHDVVDIVRRRFNIKRVGHAGTLDPLATGLLIILVGEATRQFNRFANFDKGYVASLRLGEATDSGDSQGRIIGRGAYDAVTEEQASGVLSGLVGSLESVPPMVSALKHKGKRLYSLARKGLIVERKARQVQIHSLKLLKFSLPEIEFELICSKGTYVRSLGEEIARRLSSVGHISRIRRVSVGPYSVEEAKGIENFNEDDIRPCWFKEKN